MAGKLGNGPLQGCRVLELAHIMAGPVAGPTMTLGLPVKFSRTLGGVHIPAPILGQHTREVLGEAGYSEGEISRMIESGIVVATDS